MAKSVELEIDLADGVVGRIRMEVVEEPKSSLALERHREPTVSEFERMLKRLPRREYRLRVLDG